MPKAYKISITPYILKNARKHIEGQDGKIEGQDDKNRLSDVAVILALGSECFPNSKINTSIGTGRSTFFRDLHLSEKPNKSELDRFKEITGRVAKYKAIIKTNDDGRYGRYDPTWDRIIKSSRRF